MFTFKYPIESYHDTERNMIYLNLNVSSNVPNVGKKSLDDCLEDHEYQMSRSLLFMFQVCHILLV